MTFGGGSTGVTPNAAILQSILPAGKITGRTYVQKTLWQTTVANTKYTVYTPTGGKTFYCTNISVCVVAATDVIRLGDGLGAGNAQPASATTGTAEIIMNGTATGERDVQFMIPMPIATSFDFKTSGAVPIGVSISGWEETT